MTDDITSQGNVVRPVFGKKEVSPESPEAGKLPECTCTEERMVYVCSNCSCRSYNLFADGSIACSYCELILSPGDVGSEYGDWLKCTDGAAVKDKDDFDPKPFDQHHFADCSLARRQITKKIMGWADSEQLEFITAFNTDGSATSWHNIETEEQRQWILDRMMEAMDYVEGLIIDGKTADEAMEQLELELELEYDLKEKQEQGQ